MTTAATGRAATAAAIDAFADAQAVADAVLYEGYLLYPYRRSSAKNQVRWQFGVLTPRDWIEENEVPDPGVAGAAESWFQQAQCLAEAPAQAAVCVRLRFLQLQRKQCFRLGPDGRREPVDELGDGRTTALSFDEALPRDVDVEYPLAEALRQTCEFPVVLPGAHIDEPVLGADGAELGRCERTSWPAAAHVCVSAARAEAPFPLLRLNVRVENRAASDAPGLPRPEILRQSLIATHLLIGLSAGRFVSLLDPPEWASPAAADCRNRHVFPVLAGSGEGADVVLCSPIILYDHPKVAPESPGDLHDAVEIDEILSLRTLTLTDDEKSEARATDPRAAAIVDRVDTMPPEVMAKLHGVLRDFARPRDADAIDDAVGLDPDTALVGGRRIGRGARVRLRPRGHGSDAFDMFLTGKIARVHEVLHDVDGSIRLAVTADEDPAADLQEWYGRFFHFSPDEVELVPDEAAAGEEAR